MHVRKQDDLLYVDVHGLSATQAVQRLETIIAHAQKDIRQIVVIHGYHHGQAIQTAVRTQLAHPRIKRIQPAYNAGQTLVLLR